MSGTVNDMAVMGGEPLAMASAVVVSEGTPIEKLREITKSMNETAEEGEVSIVTGDTKVVEEEALDEPIITTTGIGVADPLITDQGLEPGNRIIITGNIGEHETAILAERENIDVGEEIKSDVSPIWKMLRRGLEVGGITAMKDPTRGGIAGTLNELASKSEVGISIKESLPISTPVQNIGEMLGIEPLQLTNEGKAIVGVKSDKSKEVLKAFQKDENGENARIVGEVTDKYPGKVVLETRVGGRRIIRAPVGAPTPRIC